MFCRNCGTQIEDGAAVCPVCNEPLEVKCCADAKTYGGRSKSNMAILAFLFGSIGIHNFLMGEVKKGLINADDNKQYVNLTLFREWLENWLRNHPAVNQEMILLVRQLQPTVQGLPLELYFFSSDTNWIAYEHLQAEIFEYLFAVLPEYGLKAFQSPAGTDFHVKN